MTRDAAVAHVRDTLRGQEITSDMVGRPVPAFAVVSREALATLVEGDWTVRPLGVVESEDKRERAGASGTVGTASTTENDDKGFGHLPRPESSAPTPCAECGTPLTLFEIERIDEAKGTKFEALCSDCCYVKLGIAR
jgi:hypothetical protein